MKYSCIRTIGRAKINKSINLDILPRIGNKIDWKRSVGFTVDFIYNDTNGSFKIVKLVEDIVTILYSNELYNFSKYSIPNVSFGIMINNSQRNDFCFNINDKITSNNRNIFITDRQTILKKRCYNRRYGFHCNICGYNGTIEEYSLKRGRGCQCCNSKIIDKNINSVSAKMPWLVKYFINKKDADIYAISSNKKLFFVCPDCGRTSSKELYISTVTHSNSIGCSCQRRKSFPEKLMYYVLEKNKIKFISEYNETWSYFEFNGKIRKCKYDFYFELDNKKYIIEMDGGFHYINSSRTKLTLNERKQIDKEKDLLAKQNGIDLIRINSYHSNFEFLMNSIRQSKLSTILDLKVIDKKECLMYITNNILEIVCEMFNENYKLKQIAEKCFISKATARNYVVLGTELGLCVYDPKKASLDNYERISKKIFVYTKDKELLYVFNSKRELSRLSTDKLGIKIYRNLLEKHFKSENLIYKNYIFSKKEITNEHR